MESIAKIDVGVDISKTKLDVFILQTAEYFSVENDTKGVKKFLKKIRNYERISVGFEASGGYEAALANGLFSLANVQIFKINPNCISGFRKALQMKAKTDKIDAEIIAKFISLGTENLASLPRLTSAQMKLRHLYSQREYFKNILAETRTYSKAPFVKEYPTAVKAVIRKLEQVIESLSKQVDALVKDDQDIQEKIALITSIRGCGPEISLAFSILAPEAGTIENKQLSSLLGLAPFPRESGQWGGKTFETKCIWAHFLRRGAILFSAPSMRDFWRRESLRKSP